VLETETLVAGAGPSGLAVGACLREAGRDFVIVEAGDEVGYRWRNHYDRLHLHTDRRYSGLPHLPIPSELPKYVSRDDFAGYLDDYAKHFELEPRTGEPIESARRRDGAWEVATPVETYRVRNVVIATGANRIPNRPPLPGQDGFRGEILHSRDYKNPKPYAGKRVVVVGIGNTGGEIALDLAEAKAKDVWISVRGGVNVMPKETLGNCQQVTALRTQWVPTAIMDRLAQLTSRLTFGNLSKYGLDPLELGPIRSIIERGRVPLLDIGTVAMIKRGRIKAVRGITRVDGNHVEFADGKRVEADTIILATGYRSGLGKVIDGSDQVLDEHGKPTVMGSESALPGLFFVGYRNPTTGILYNIALDAKTAAAQIVERSTTKLVG
jgi:hypothetical protein